MKLALVCKECLELTWSGWSNTLGNWGDRKFWTCDDCVTKE